MKGKLSQKDLKALAKEVAYLNGDKKIMPAPPTPPPIEQERQYTVKEIAEMTKRTPWTVRKHIDDKLLKATKVGKSWLISETNYKNYLNE